MASSSMVRGSITRRGSEESGMDTRSVGDLAGARVGRRGMTGHLHLDSAGVGVGVGGAAIRGGGAGIIMASWQQRGPIHLALLEASTHEQVALHPARAVSRALTHALALPAPTILAPEPWPLANAQRCKAFPIIPNPDPL